jgi:DNA-binding response OmpR family regulator
MAAKILVVDDDKAMSSLVRDTLVNKGYSVTVKGTAEEALQSIRANLPDLLILDVGLPGFSGLHLCEALKKDQATSSLLILMLTSQNQEAQKVHGLEAGADDYVTKPFSVREFNARIEALLRRQSRPVSTQQVLQGHGIVMRVDSHDVLVDGNKVALRPKEYALLELLLRSEGIGSLKHGEIHALFFTETTREC